MLNDSDRRQDPEYSGEPQHHCCGSLFGCGEENGTGVLREDIKDAAFTKRAADRLLHMEEVNQERLDGLSHSPRPFASAVDARQQFHGGTGGDWALVS